MLHKYSNDAIKQTVNSVLTKEQIALINNSFSSVCSALREGDSKQQKRIKKATSALTKRVSNCFQIQWAFYYRNCYVVMIVLTPE